MDRAAGSYPARLSSSAYLVTTFSHSLLSLHRTRRLNSDQEESSQDEDMELPDDVADAWAAVLIDVHEKTKQDKQKEPPSSDEQ